MSVLTAVKVLPVLAWGIVIERMNIYFGDSRKIAESLLILFYFASVCLVCAAEIFALARLSRPKISEQPKRVTAEIGAAKKSEKIFLSVAYAVCGVCAAAFYFPTNFFLLFISHAVRVNYILVFALWFGLLTLVRIIMYRAWKNKSVGFVAVSVLMSCVKVIVPVCLILIMLFFGSGMKAEMILILLFLLVCVAVSASEIVILVRISKSVLTKDGKICYNTKDNSENTLGMEQKSL